jgi:maleate isomerase
MSQTVAELTWTDRPAQPRHVIEAGHAQIPAMKYGARLRLGMIIPSVCSNAEAHISAMLPEGVTLHTTRLKMNEKDADSMLDFIDRLEEAAGLLKDAGCQHILVNCTGVTTADPEIGSRISARVRAATGLPSNTTGDAVRAALGALGARKIVLLTPYRRAINEREVRYLEHFGFEVLDWEGLELNGAQDFDEVTPQQWHDLVRAHRNDAADVYFISCAQIRIVEVIGALERDFGRPVITSNQAATWNALRERGIKDRVPGFGTLLQI